LQVLRYSELIIFFIAGIAISSAQAQHLSVVEQTDFYKIYEYSNDSLTVTPDYDLLIPYQNSGQAVEIISSELKTVKADQFPDTESIQRWGLSTTNTPIYSIKNVGMHRNQRVASMLIHTTRTRTSANQNLVNNELELVIVKNLRFRVSAPLDKKTNPAAGFNQSLNPESFILNNEREHPLSSGQWIKIPISKSGIYAINTAYLEEAGINTETINTGNVQIWTTSGEPLPRLNSAPRSTLMQIPIQMDDGGDSSFDDGDRILFYAKEPHKVLWNDNLGQYIHELHPYSSNNFVFLRLDGPEPGLRLSPFNAPNSPSLTITEFKDFTWLEEEQFKTEEDMKSGLEWYGEEFNNDNAARNDDPDDQNIWAFKVNREIFNDTIPGIDFSSDITLRIRMIGRSTRPMEFDIFANNQFIEDMPVSQIRSYVASEFSSARVAQLNTTFQLPGNNEILTIQGSMKNNETSTQGWVDYIELSYTRRLVAENDVLSFFSPQNPQNGSGQFARYQLQGFSSQPTVMDVTNPVNPTLIPVQSAGNQFNAVGSASPQRKFVAQSRFFTPEAPQVVQNQNLHGISGFPDFIIISGDNIVNQAQEFAQYRSDNSNLSTVVATQTQIFNEFSAGVPDVVALRDYVKFLYDRAEGNPDRLPRYLLLFGDTSFDYKGVSQRANQQNLIFTFQSRESIFRTSTYGSDDFFGLLDDNEGEWSPTTRAERVDIGIGRFPAQNREDADIILDKIKRYESTEALGDWRSLFTFAADDGINGNENDEDLHVFNADFTARAIDTDESAVRINKIYEFGFPVENTSQGRRRPSATDAFLRSINEGALITNYMGHGDETTLSGERLFNIDQIPELTNSNRLTLMVTATCSFGRFDDVVLQSGAEQMFLWPDGGSIGAFTTSRVVFTSSNATGGNNFGLNIALTREMVRKDQNGLPRRLGDIYQSTKNTFAGSVFNSRKFILIGDPSMRFGLPSLQTRITEINRQTITDSTQLVRAKALDKISLKGQIENASNQMITDFNGVTNLQVFDANRFVNLPPLDWVPELCDTPNCGYFVENDLLFKGRSSTNGGRFEAEFIVPRDISFSDSTGRILMYSQSAGTDASGSFNRINFNGINEQALNDDKGPKMDVFLNDEMFVNGSLVNSSPRLIVQLSDESGINTTGLGVGHELIATLDTEPPQTFTLNDFFESELDQFNSGRIEFPLQDLPEGVFNLNVRAWDVHNNPTEQSIQFEVANTNELTVKNIFNYPNPMTSSTEFIFEHNQSGNPLDIAIKIYTLSGRPVKYIKRNGFIPSGNLVRIPWGGRDQDNQPIANGTYIYVVQVRADTPSGRQREEKIEKLVIIK